MAQEVQMYFGFEFIPHKTAMTRLNSSTTEFPPTREKKKKILPTGALIGFLTSMPISAAICLPSPTQLGDDLG